jgi:hypothetical protein
MSTGEKSPLTRKPSLPSPQAFLIGRKVYEDRYRRAFVLVKPADSIALPSFPAGCCLSLYLYLVGGHGVYTLALELRNAEGEAVWRYQWPEPIRYADPLVPCMVALHDTTIPFPAPGRYDMVLMANGEDFAHHALEVTTGSR